MPLMLFVCTGNTCRSSMAAAIARHLAAGQGLDIEVASAGIAAVDGEPATIEAVRALAEMGISLEGHRACRVKDTIISEADIILTMTLRHKEYLICNFPDAVGKTFTLKEYVLDKKKEAIFGGSDIPDPVGMPLSAYRDLSRELMELVVKALQKFKQEKK